MRLFAFLHRSFYPVIVSNALPAKQSNTPPNIFSQTDTEAIKAIKILPVVK